MSLENQKQFELTEDQQELFRILSDQGLNYAGSEGGPQNFAEAKDKAQQIIQQKLNSLGYKKDDPETEIHEDIKKWLKFKESNSDLNKVLESKGFSEKPVEQEIREFYESDHFKALYLKTKALKKPGERVEVKDIADLLKTGSLEDKRIFKILDAPENKALSYMGWNKAEIKRNTEQEFNDQEKADIETFFTKFSELPPEAQKDVDSLLAEFAKQRPLYAVKTKEDWYKNYFKQQLDQLKNPDLKKLNDFYNKDIKELYNTVSTSLGRAPEWDDIAAEIKKRGLDDLLNVISRNRKANKDLWTPTWQKAKEEFESFEEEALQKFTDTKTRPQDWTDLDKLATEFQKTRKRFSGDRRFKYYKDQLEQKKHTKERVWKMDMQDFYHSKLPAIYEQVAQQKNGAPEWKDIRKFITDPNLLYLLENTFKTESETTWTVFWKQKKENFDNTETKTLDNFLQKLDPSKLDDPTAVAALYEADGKFKASNAWFKSKLETHKSAEQARMESVYEQTVSTLPDSTIAKAMFASFKKAANFTQRVEWQQQTLTKVSEYSGLIKANNERESELAAKTERHPDLKKEFGKIISQYNEGKKTYNENFYSPRKHAEALAVLNNKLLGRERLVESTITKTENKTFNQIPKLTDKKKLTYDEFRDELKKLNFYNLDPKVRKDERVRTTLRKRTKALHQQWLDHRSLYLEQNTRAQVEKSKSVIRGVKLPKNLPTGISKMEDFTLALKKSAVYAALPSKMMQNEMVRQSAHEHNRKLFAQYQVQEAKTAKNVETEKEINTEPKLKQAKDTISRIKLTVQLQSQIAERLKGKDATNPDTFTVALRELSVYQGVDKSLWQNPELRELAWQKNRKLQAAFLENQKSGSSENQENNTENAENNYGLPGHYRINWKGLDERLTPQQKNQSIERFKQMHNRSDIGLQTIMQQFHQPLGSFILETLAVMPKDRFEKALTALKDVRVEAGKKSQASEWMKVLCESAGLGYLQKEASTAWSKFKQNFSTHFGHSLEASWEVEESLDILPTTESVEADDKNKAEKLSEEIPDKSELEPDDEVVIEIETSVESPDDIVLEDTESLPKGNLEAQATAIEKPDESEIFDEAKTIPPQIKTTKDVVLNESDLTVNDSHLGKSSEKDALISKDLDGESLEGDLLASGILEETIDETLDEEIDDPAKEPEVPTQPALDGNLELSDTDEDLEIPEIGTPEDNEISEAPAETPEATLEDRSEDLLETHEEEIEAVEETVEGSEEHTGEIPDPQAPAAEQEAPLDEALHEEEINEAPDAEDPPLESLETEPEPLEDDETVEESVEENEKIPEIIIPELLPPEVIAAQTQAATKGWKNFIANQAIETPLPTNTNQVPQWLQNKPELKAEDIDKLTPKEIEALLQNPLYRRRLQTHLRQQKTLHPNESHFFTGVYQETYFSQSLTAAKFLEQIKSYCLYSLDLEIKTQLTDNATEISQNQAQTLFSTFADKLHSTHNITALTACFENQQLRVNLKTKQKTEVWTFALPLDQAA